MNRDDWVNYCMTSCRCVVLANWLVSDYAWTLLNYFFLPQWLGGAKTVVMASGSIKSRTNESV